MARYTEREELFAGAEPRQQQQSQTHGGKYVEEMDNREVMQLAVRTHQDTTATYRRGLQAMEEAVEIQAKTLEVLNDQGKQMNAIRNDFDKIGKDISYSERILRFMRMCCLCGFCCSCIHEPEGPKNDEQWRAGGRGNQEYVPGQAAHKMRVEHQQSVADYSRVPDNNRSYVGPDTSAVRKMGYEYEGRVIEDESRKQEEYLDQIGRHLEVLKAGALDMRGEVTRQTDYMGNMRDDAEELNDKINHVNTKTQLAAYAPKAKK